MNVPKITNYAINATAGALVNIVATTWCRRVEIIEDDAAAATGLVMTLPADNFTQQYTFSAAHEPIVLGHPVLSGVGVAPLLGVPAQTLQTDTSKIAAGNAVPATILCKLVSKAGATNVQVKEWQ